MRKADILTPAIFITSLNNIEDLTQGYNCGGCDYIRKPFDLAELRLRVEQAIKMYCFKSPNNSIDLPFGYKYDTKKMRLYFDDNSKIEIKLYQKDKYLLFEVQDYGVGIANVDKIFSRYYRENETKGGFGIGLNIVKEIIDKEGIELDIQSVVNEGTLFCYTFKFIPKY